MKKPLFRIDPATDIIIDVAESYEADNPPEDYKELQIERYPNDVRNGYYRLTDGEIVKDDELYSIFIENQEMPSDEYDGGADDIGLDVVDE